MLGFRALNISETLLLLVCLGPSVSSSLPHLHPATLSVGICPLTARSWCLCSSPCPSDLESALRNLPSSCLECLAGWLAAWLCPRGSGLLCPYLPHTAATGQLCLGPCLPPRFLFGGEGFVSTVTSS